MSRPDPLTFRTRHRPTCSETLRCRGALTIRFNSEMSGEAGPTGRRDRQQTYSGAVTQTSLFMKVLFGMALRQTTGVVESLLRLVGFRWSVHDFSTVSRRQKALPVNIPCRGSTCSSSTCCGTSSLCRAGAHCVTLLIKLECPF